MMIHAPSSAFVIATMHEHDGGRDGADAVDERARPPARLAQPPPVKHHAELRQRERDEHADHVERDQRVRVAAEDDEQQAAKTAERDDSVREGKPVPLVGELPRQESRRARRSTLSRGKSAYAVFAASTRISIVAAWTARYSTPRPPNVPRAICDTTVSVSDGTT